MQCSNIRKMSHFLNSSSEESGGDEQIKLILQRWYKRKNRKGELNYQSNLKTSYVQEEESVQKSKFPDFYLVHCIKI